jgi:hypothetical protein
MKSLMTACIAALFLLCAWTAFADDLAPIGPDTLLRQEADISQLPLLSYDKAGLQSSYDRSGGNYDCGNFLSVTNNVAVLADIKGPGAIVRIWSADPMGQLKVYIDDNPQPVIDMPFGHLFDNSTAPFLNPVSGQSSGGVYTYLPITFAKHCVVTTEKLNYYYQVTYKTFPAGTNVRPFALPLTSSDQAALSALGAAWTAQKLPVVSIKPESNGRIPAGKTSILADYKGSGEISQIDLSLADTNNTDLRKLVLRVYFDNHSNPDVEAPVADFFGNGFGRSPFNSTFLAQSADGTLIARFPMPYGQDARFTLENGSLTDQSYTWAATVTPEPFDLTTDGYFHAQFNAEVTVNGRPHIWTKVQGERGKLVGIVLNMNGNRGIGFLEGDDQIRVDDQKWTPAPAFPDTVIGPWNGTGTEDCFNSGWYFNAGPVNLPVSGLLVKNEQGQIDCYRWFINDAPVFQSSIDAQIEHGPTNSFPGVPYSSVAYWYSNGPMVDWQPPLTAASIPELKHNPPPVLPNAIEGESLKSEASAGQTSTQSMYYFGSGWSDEQQLTWNGGSIGDKLKLYFPVARPGIYDLIGYFTKAGDYGIVSFNVNGIDLPVKFDGYTNFWVVPSGPVDLGEVILPGSQGTLTVTITGKNPAATNTFFGLDALCLIRSGTTPPMLVTN